MEDETLLPPPLFDPQEGDGRNIFFSKIIVVDASTCLGCRDGTPKTWRAQADRWEEKSSSVASMMSSRTSGSGSSPGSLWRGTSSATAEHAFSNRDAPQRLRSP